MSQQLLTLNVSNVDGNSPTPLSPSRIVNVSVNGIQVQVPKGINCLLIFCNSDRDINVAVCRVVSLTVNTCVSYMYF
jgi:hypothetical protein